PRPGAKAPAHERADGFAGTVSLPPADPNMGLLRGLLDARNRLFVWIGFEAQPGIPALVEEIKALLCRLKPLAVRCSRAVSARDSDSAASMYSLFGAMRAVEFPSTHVTSIW